MRFIFQILFFIGFCIAEYLQPIGNSELEILEINGKSREYYISRGNDLKYEIKGPKLVVLNARKPAPKRHNEKIDISFTIHLEGSNPVHHYGKNDLSNAVYSKKHPAHTYTNSEKIYINIPNGIYNLNINSDENPILFRVTTKKKPKRKKTDSVLSTNCGDPIIITTGNKSKEYSIIESQNAGIFNLTDEKLLWLYIRGIHDNNELKPIILNYKNPINEGFQKLIFYSEPSLISKSKNIEGYIGKLRTFSIPLSEGFDRLILENLSNFDVLIHGGIVQNDE